MVLYIAIINARRNTMFQSHIGELASLVTAVSWTVTAVAFESAGKRVGSLAVNFIRLAIAFILISFFTLFTRGMFLPMDATSTNWLWLTVSGIIGLVLGDFFLFQAYVEIGSRTSMLIMAAVPPITAITGFILMGEKLTLIDILGMLITVGGIALVILVRGSNEKKVVLSHPIKGLAFAFTGALGQAFGLIFSKIGMGNYNPFAATQIRIIAGLICFTVIITFSKHWGKLLSTFNNLKAIGEISVGAFFGPFLGVSFSLLAVQYATDEELNLQPGQGYFIAEDGETMDNRIRYEIMPLIKEYLAEGMVLLGKDAFVNYFYNRIHEVMFR
jgi:drug/metabolite transporter (DMT)-like permease